MLIQPTKEEKDQLAKFFGRISGWSTFEDGYLEIVRDFNISRYFSKSQFSDIYPYILEIINAGQECHYGPAIRREDLGSGRSKRDNVLYSRCLWVDIDPPDKTLLPDEQHRQAEALKNEFINALTSFNISPSYIVKSGNGFHIYFLLKKIFIFPSDEWEKMEDAIIRMANSDLQVKDPTRILRVPFTFNLKDKENPKRVEIVYHSDAVLNPEDLNPIIAKYGKKKSSKDAAAPVATNPLGFIPPCIDHLLDPNTAVPLGDRHLSRLVLSTFGFHEGWPVEEIIRKAAHFTDNPKKSEEDVRGVYEALQSDPSKYNVGCNEGSLLRSLIDAGVTVCDEANCKFKQPSLPPNEIKTEEELTYSASFDGLVDLVLDDKDKVVFLFKEGENLVLKENHIVDNRKMVPPPRDKILWKLPKASTVIDYYNNDKDDALFKSLVDFFKTVSDLPDDDHYSFLASYTMHTYLVDKGEYSPIVWLYAIPERGKTRTGKAITYVSFRGVLQITIRESHVIRIAKDHRATVFFDISDLWKEAEAGGVKDVLLNRYEKGATVARVLYPERGPFADTVHYQVYGATVVATNEPVNEILATRAIMIIMPEAKRKFTEDVKEVNCLPLRERLLGFRARWMDKDLPNVDKPSDGRLADILHPIRQIVAIACQDESWFLRFVSGVEQRKKLSGADTLDAQVVAAIKDCLKTIKHGHMLHDDILAKFNQNRSEMERISPQKLGRVTARLGFGKYNSGQQRGIYFDEKLFIQLCERYGIESGIITTNKSGYVPGMFTNAPNGI